MPQSFYFKTKVNFLELFGLGREEWEIPLLKFDKFVTRMNPAIKRKQWWNDEASINHASHMLLIQNEQNPVNQETKIPIDFRQNTTYLKWIDTILNRNHWIFFFEF